MSHEKRFGAIAEIRPRVLVAMSGGVDSSVAAGLLLEQGFDVIGVTMQLWDYSKNEVQACDPTKPLETCCSHEDVADARAVAQSLGIPFYVLDYEDDFERDVVDYFTEEYLKGRTPNPCVACNTFLKFDRLLDRAHRLGCDFVATGHYARIEKSDDGVFHLLKGVDLNKDQSYFLYSMTQERLSRIIFPLGAMTKDEVRAHAERLGLPVAAKRESMEICFVPGNDYAAFVQRRAGADRVIKGEVFHEDGRKLGDHDGIHQFTIGQRKGLGYATGAAVYVTAIDSKTGRVTVGPHESLKKTTVAIEKFHNVRSDRLPENLEIRIRYRSRPASGRLQIEEQGHAVFIFDEPQAAVTPGQIAVVYRGDEVLGGGFIAEAENR